MSLKNLFLFGLSLHFFACSTIDIRSKPPAIEHFHQSYDKIYDDLIKTNSFSFIYKNDTYDFNLAKTYIDTDPQQYYLGYKNGSLAYIVLEKNIILLKEVFASKKPLYQKTENIVEKLNQLNLYPSKSIDYKTHPKNSLIYDLTSDTLDFVVYGTMAMIALPLVLGGYADYLSKDLAHSKLNKIRLRMTRDQVNQLIPEARDQKKIDSYKVELFTTQQAHWYTNALLIFENDILVGFIRSVTNEPITNYYQKL